VHLLVDDSQFSFGAAVLSIYAPLGDGGANEEGLSMLCTVGDYDVLVTGDMNDVVERRLIRYQSLPDIELLVVGHHGSKDSTSEDLLLITRPERAVISSGYNSYGHPAPETLERLGAAGCDIYLTDRMGTVTFTIKGE
jgi:competence protein ComEC